MRSYAHPVHSGAAAALFSAAAAAAPSSSSSCCRALAPRQLSTVLFNRQRQTRLGLGGSTHRCARASPSSNATMQRLLIATHRRIPGRPCLACRSSTNGAGGGDDYDKIEESPPQDAVLKAISEVSKAEGRVGKTTNMVIGGTVNKDSESQWDAIDQKVNVYPMVRDFTAIGTGGDEFVLAMVRAVESITESPAPKVTKKLSSQGKYVSVKIGGITVTSSEQVRAVYDAMRKDVRMKYFL